MNTTFKQVREQLKTLIEETPELSGVPVFLEHGADDLEERVETALATTGLAVCVWMASGAVSDQISRGGAMLRVSLPVSLIENPAVNMNGDEGKKLPSEDALQAVLLGVTGRPCGAGEVTLGQEVFARASGDSGELETVIGFEAPLLLRKVLKA
jgi:hypothetical protein